MAEENKEKKEEAKPEAPKAENKAAETPKVEPQKQEAPKTEAPKAEAAAKPAEEKKIEKPVNCAVCNKSIKKKRYYYRNGKYFCTKRCWKTTIKKEEKPIVPENPSDAKDQTPSK